MLLFVETGCAIQLLYLCGPASMNTHAFYMYRCLELAQRGAGRVAPNPMVGAVLVYQDRIIGEGWHQQYGAAHAEVNCLNSVAGKELISQSTLYVSLEPCAHFGKTPPCTDLIIRNRIPRVVIGCTDVFSEVNGKGIGKLKAAGVELTEGVLENECIDINKRFFTFHTKRRPYVILKWAKSSDGKIAGQNGERIRISNAFSDRLVHRWRSEEASILVGTNTARLDDPELTNRLWTGMSPLRLVIDKELSLPSHLKLFDKINPTVVFNRHRTSEDGMLRYQQLDGEQDMFKAMLDYLHATGIQSVLVEGGSGLLQSVIDSGNWDEARVITSTPCIIGAGVEAPELDKEVPRYTERMDTDTIDYYYRTTASAWK